MSGALCWSWLDMDGQLHGQHRRYLAGLILSYALISLGLHLGGDDACMASNGTTNR
jgi:hypothetical protein